MSISSESHSDAVPGISEGFGVTSSASSELGSALRAIRPRVRQLLGISDIAISVIDVIVTVVKTLTDDSDARPWHQRLESLDITFPDLDGLDPNAFEASVRGLADGGLERWVKRLETQGGRLFFRRLLGAAAYDRVVEALKVEGSAVVGGIRRGFRAFMPTVMALQDCCSLLGEEQLAELEGFSNVQDSMIGMMVAIDSLLEQLVQNGFQLSALNIREEDVGDLQSEASELVDTLRLLITEMSHDELTDLSDPLARKIDGARDALEHSVDGVSQGANSLTEFIDRLLRGAFDDEFVLLWLERNYPGTKDLTHMSQGSTLPTKRGQALCFVHGGRDVDAPSPFHQIAAAGLVESRRNLQQLKHADVGTPAERELMERLLHAVEGYFMFAIRAGWSGADLERREHLKARFQQAA